MVSRPPLPLQGVKQMSIDDPINRNTWDHVTIPDTIYMDCSSFRRRWYSCEKQEIGKACEACKQHWSNLCLEWSSQSTPSRSCTAYCNVVFVFEMIHALCTFGKQVNNKKIKLYIASTKVQLWLTVWRSHKNKIDHANYFILDDAPKHLKYKSSPKLFVVTTWLK